MSAAVKIRYRGANPASIDEKGRLNMPKELRDKMDQNEHIFWVITSGFEGQLVLYPKRRWEEIEEQFDTESPFDPDMQAFLRMFLGNFTEGRRDTLGRLTIPALQRAAAEIEKKAVLVGMGDCLELWSEPAYLEYQKREAGNYKAMARQLFGKRNSTHASNEGA